MPYKQYATIPTPHQFYKDSSLLTGFGFRKKDLEIQEIDRTLGAYERVLIDQNMTADERKRGRLVALDSIYAACEAWLRLCDLNKKRRGRRWAVYGLFDKVAREIGAVAGIAAQHLDTWRKQHLGVGLKPHGFEIDHEQKAAKYLTQTQADMFRIRFSGGLALQKQWWLTPQLRSRVLAESERGKPKGNKEMRDGHAGFVLSMSNEFYSGRHETGPGSDNFYHSSYLAGGTVRFAGTWRIEKGRVTEITNASGHYRPTKDQTYHVVQALKDKGVNLRHLRVFLYPDTVGINAIEFLRNKERMTLEQLKELYVSNEKAVNKQRADLHGRQENAIKEQNAKFAKIVDHFRKNEHFNGKNQPCKVFKCKTCLPMRQHWNLAKAFVSDQRRMTILLDPTNRTLFTEIR